MIQMLLLYLDGSYVNSKAVITESAVFLFPFGIWIDKIVGPLKEYLKTYLTFRFSDVFRGYRKATPGCDGLSKLKDKFFNCDTCH